jgi:hypothetical protein
MTHSTGRRVLARLRRALAIGLLAGAACGDTRSEVIVVNRPAGDATALEADAGVK